MSMPHADEAAAGGGAAAAAEPSATGTALDPCPLAVWTRNDDKLLEMLVVRYPLQWDVIASRLGGNKTPEQALRRYERTVDEVTRVLQQELESTPRERDMQMVVAASSSADREAVVAPAAVPDVADVVEAAAGQTNAAVTSEKMQVTSSAADDEVPKLGARKRKQRGGGERKKPEKWTKEEHILFLEGLEKYGTGKWKTMSSEYLTTKSASQIASHHQKHCKRLEQRKRNACKRASIHDITEPTTSVAAVAAGGEFAAPARKDDGVVEPGASASAGELVGPAVDEEFPGEEYDFESLFYLV